jgi:hypothetical protein
MLLVLLPLVLGAIAALSFAGAASAASGSSCGKQVLADWYDNGRIDKLYPLNCYDEAIDEIPSDIGPYVDAEEVITRALQSALHGKVSTGGGCDPSADGSSDDCADGAGGGNNSGNNGGGPGGGNADDGSGTGGEVAPAVDTSSPSSVPIPLIVLGGMSLLLLAAGALGYVSRRRNAAHADELGDSSNPPV